MHSSAAARRLVSLRAPARLTRASSSSPPPPPPAPAPPSPRASAAAVRAWPRQTLPWALSASAERWGGEPALRALRGADGAPASGAGTLDEWSYSRYAQSAARAARGLRALLSARAGGGLARHAGVALLAGNCPEWHVFCAGGVAAGGLAAGLYATSSAAQVRAQLALARAAAVLVDEPAQLDKVLAAAAGGALPELRLAVLAYQPPPALEAAAARAAAAAAAAGVRLVSWAELLVAGEEAGSAQLPALAPEDPAVLIFTSGTTGASKAAALSHDNILFTVRAADAELGVVPGERVVSYLPLSHVAAQLVDVHGPLLFGLTVCFAGRDALRGSLVDALREAQPHYFLGVPRVYEKIAERLAAVGAAAPPWRAAATRWAKGVASRATAAELACTRPPAAWPAVRALAFGPLRHALGWQRVKMFGCGAAPMAPATLAYFASLGIVIREVYGLSETTGPHTSNTLAPGATRLGSVGRPLVAGMRVAIDAAAPGAEGEVCLAGRNVFLGYAGDAAATAAALGGPPPAGAPAGEAPPAGAPAAEHRWLRTGDLGRLDADGFLTITGRAKELLITAGGENVAPVPLEEAVKAAAPALISQCVVVGDGRRHLAALVTLRTEEDLASGAGADGAPPAASGGAGASAGAAAPPADRLDATALRYVRAHCGVTGTPTAREALRMPAVRAAVAAAVAAANAHAAVSNAGRIASFDIVHPDFSVAGGELTPTLKLKRKAVAARRAADIDAIYSRPAEVTRTLT